MTGLVVFCALGLALYAWVKPAAAEVPVFADSTKGHDAYLAAVTNGLEV